MPGRVLSKANEAKLRSASEALAQILSLLDKEEESESKEALSDAEQACSAMLKDPLHQLFCYCGHRALHTPTLE
jgi:vacuolar-type H+-ATPase subunit H